MSTINIVTDKDLKGKIIEFLKGSRIKAIDFEINPINNTIKVIGNILESKEALKFDEKYVGLELKYINEDNTLRLGENAIKGSLIEAKRFVKSY